MVLSRLKATVQTTSPLDNMSTQNNAKLVQIMTIAGVNAKTTGATVIFTTESVSNFYVTGVTVESTSATAITVPATLSVGTNAATYNNILAAGAMTSLTAANLFSMLLPTVASVVVAASTAINVNISVAATGTSQTLTVGVQGYYGP